MNTNWYPKRQTSSNKDKLVTIRQTGNNYKDKLVTTEINW
jgi:hypothetical protein